MELSDIATISGKPGLYRILQPTRTGMILETLDEKRTKTVAGPSSRVSILKEISIYTLNKDGSIPLESALQLLYAKYGNKLPIEAGADNATYFKVISAAITDLDQGRVYASDLKKLVSWYGIIARYASEILTAKVEKATPDVQETSEEATATAPKSETKKASAKKVKASKD
jgi:hypothetical protein